MQTYLSGERVLLCGRQIDFSLSDQAHLSARGPEVDDVGLEHVHDEPSQVGLVLNAVQLPRTLIGNGSIVEPFGRGESLLSHPDSSFTEAPKDL